MEQDDFIGKRIGQIEIVEKIGEGGMGSVYKGMHTFLGKEVAIKFLSKALVENKEFIDRFIREAQTLAKVEHRNLVRVFDAGEWEGNYYIVMEFIKGKSLGDVLKTRARLPWREAVSIIRECAQGLKAAAARGGAEVIYSSGNAYAGKINVQSTGPVVFNAYPPPERVRPLQHVGERVGVLPRLGPPVRRGHRGEGSRGGHTRKIQGAGHQGGVVFRQAARRHGHGLLQERRAARQGFS